MPRILRGIGKGGIVLSLCIAGLVPAALAGKNFVKPTAKSAINYPAHDFHRDEQVAIAADRSRA